MYITMRMEGKFAMKKRTAFILFTLALLLCLLPLGALADGDRYLEINETNFPDEQFREYIISDLDVSGDEDTGYYMTEAQVKAVTSIDCGWEEIASLKGIEHFTALTRLDCSYNQLTSLDLSHNTALTSLYCGGNQLTSLDLNHNTALTSLDCNGNQLTSLDLSHNTALTSLYCNGNQLTSLDLSHNTALTSLYCGGNQLTSLDLSHNTALTSLYCGGNQLTSLDLSHNTALTSLECYYNQLTSLDLSHNTALTRLDCSYNQLTSLDLSHTPSLTDLSCDYNQLTSLDLSHNTALTSLDCGGNQLTTLDLNHNTALTYLRCNSNQLTSLDLSHTPSLTDLSCDYNQLTSLDLSHTPSLTELYCYNNRLTSLDVSKNTALVELYCNDNQLSSLDLSHNTALTYLGCYYNQLTTLTMGQNAELRELYCYGNRLTSLDVRDCTKLWRLSCFNNQLTALSFGSSISELYCYNNKLTSLDVSACEDLQYLWCQDNRLTSLKVPDPWSIYCYNNQLTALDLGGCTRLQWLYAYNNQLTALDVSTVPNLQVLDIDNNAIRVLDLSTVEAENKTRVQIVEEQTMTSAGGNYIYDLTQLVPLAQMDRVTAEGLDPATGRVTFSTPVGSFYYAYDTGCGPLNVTVAFGNAEGLVPPTITQQPEKDCFLPYKTQAQFTCVAVGKGLTYRWQSKAPGAADWMDVEEETGRTSHYTFVPTAAKDKYEYRCVVSNAAGSVTSKAAVLWVGRFPRIWDFDWAGWEDIETTSGNTVRLSADVESIGSYDGELGYVRDESMDGEVLTINWFVQTSDGGAWVAAEKCIDGLEFGYYQYYDEEDDEIYDAYDDPRAISFIAKDKYDGYRFRVEATYCGHTDVSSPITLTVKSDHDHVPGEAVRENEVPATCAAEGSYDEVTYCTVCGKELSRTQKTVEKLAHTPGEAVKENEVAATCGADGGYDMTVYCTVCHEELSREHTVIEKTGDHTPSEPVKENEVTATCVADGSYDEVVHCTVCGEVLSTEHVEVEKTGVHTPGAPVRENEVKATTTTRGHYDEVVYCTVCGEELSREEKVINKSVKGLTITGEPESATVKNGEKAKFTVKISGKATAIQWYYRTSETAKWKKVSSKGNKLTLTVTGKPGNDGYQYRCELKNGKKKLYSDTVTLDVELFPPTISSQPESVAIKAGEEATFTFGVEGEGVTYAWSYRKSATGKWAAVKGGTRATLTVTGTAANAGYQYKCEAKNKDGSVTSDIVTLDVEYHLPEIVTQPKGVKVKKNAKVTFTVEANDPYEEELTFQWYYRKSSKAKWTKIKGATEATYSFKASTKKSGYQFKCDITNRDGTVSSKAATLKVK